jgi:hypothetical protein
LKRKRERGGGERKKKRRKGKYRDLGSVSSPSFSSNGGT